MTVETKTLKTYKRKSGNNGSKHWKWQGSVRFNIDGHLEIYKPDHKFARKNRRVPLHRFVYEYFHKCCLLPWVEVHHINGIKTDNHKHNLMAISISEHRSIHSKGNKYGKKDMSDRICLLCNSKITYIDKKTGYKMWYKFNSGFLCMKCYYDNKKKYT